MAEERIIGTGLHWRSYPKEGEYCVACRTSATGGANEIVAAFGPFCRDEAQEIASETQTIDCEGANYYPRRLSPAELRRADERKLKRS